MFDLKTISFYVSVIYYFMILQDPTHVAFKEKMKEFMAKFDKNADGRIEMSEVRTNEIQLLFK